MSERCGRCLDEYLEGRLCPRSEWSLLCWPLEPLTLAELSDLGWFSAEDS